MHRKFTISFTFLLLVLLLTIPSGCTYFSSSSVSSYLEKVSSIQSQSDSALIDLNTHINELSGESAQAEIAVAELQADRDAVGGARQSIEALEAPDEAVPLRNDLLDLYSKGAGLLDELITAGNYLLQFEPLRNSYEEAADKFSNDMSANPSGEAMLLSLSNYENSIKDVSDKAKLLEPAVTSKKSHERFIQDLDALSANLSELKKAIEDNDSAAIQAASDKLSSSSSQSQEMKQAVDAARTEDIRAYNDRINEISALNQKVQQDQVELQQGFASDKQTIDALGPLRI